MEAQTDKYVTYGLERFHCGASCGSEKYYYTFYKNDGHQMKEIISHDNLVHFFDNYPEYAAKDEYLWKFSPEDNYDNTCYGLLEDHFSFNISGWHNHFFSVDVPYSQIFSYLSQETQTLVEQTGEDEPMLPAYLHERSEDGQVWMEVDTINYALLGYVRAAGGPIVDTLIHYEPELEVYPKQVHSMSVADGSPVYIFIYSRGHLLYCDEALTCVMNDEGHLQPIALFLVEGQKDSIISCMWYDQRIAACDDFPYEVVDENRLGIRYDRFTRRLYVPHLELHDVGTEFEDCPRYTGRYDVLISTGRSLLKPAWMAPGG